jgi:hypothetical protein
MRYEYENVHTQWENDGQPRGMFWNPPPQSGNLFKRTFLGHPGFMALKLLLITPDWVKHSVEAAGHLKRFRQFGLYWNIGLLIWFLLFALLTSAFTLR